MPGPVSQTCSSSALAAPPAADQHRAVARCSGSRSRPGCGRSARPAAGRRRRPACRRGCAARAPSRTPPARSAAAPCGRCRRARSRCGCTSTPPLSMRVMSSSSENRPSSASTDSLMLLTSCATSGSWLRARSASANRPIACSGWRRSWLAAAKNCVLARLATSASCARRVGDRLLGAQLHRERLGAQLQADDAVERRAVVAAEQHRHSHRHRHHAGQLPAERRVLQRDADDRRHEDQQDEENEQAELRRQDRHAGDAEGVDDEDERELVQAAAIGREEPRRHAPEHARREHAGLPDAQAPLETGGGAPARRARSGPRARRARARRSRRRRPRRCAARAAPPPRTPSR